MTAQEIIVRPVITEKSMAGVGEKKYTFEVAPSAGKIEIAKAACAARAVSRAIPRAGRKPS